MILFKICVWTIRGNPASWVSVDSYVAKGNVTTCFLDLRKSSASCVSVDSYIAEGKDIFLGAPQGFCIVCFHRLISFEIVDSSVLTRPSTICETRLSVAHASLTMPEKASQNMISLALDTPCTTSKKLSPNFSSKSFFLEVSDDQDFCFC